jgi:ribosomal protein L10
MQDRTMLSEKLELKGLVEPPPDDVEITGEFRYWFINEEGMRVSEDHIIRNLVVDSGKAFLANRAIANTKNPISHVAIGSGTTPPAATQTQLVAETARVALSTATSTNNVVNCAGTVPAGTGTGTVEEVALFNAATLGDMISRTLTGTITKPAGLGLQFTWTLTVN